MTTSTKTHGHRENDNSEPGTNTRAVSDTPPLLVNDEIAVERIRGGDIRSYEILMRRYNQRLFRIARSILKDDDSAQDAIQEVYVAAFYKLDRFSPRGSFVAWLTRIMVNEALMIKRKERTYEKYRDACNLEINEIGNQLMAPRTNPADVVASDELAQLIEAAVDQLPDDFRAVFVLRAIQQLSVRETAETLDIKEATVKTRFHRARNLMQTKLQSYMDVAGLRVFEFAGKRCDDMVESVLKRLGVDAGTSPLH